MKRWVAVLAFLSGFVFGGEFTAVQLSAITPNDLIRELHLKQLPTEGYVFNIQEETVRLLINSATNKVLILGSNEAAGKVADLIHFLDVPPRQISIEVQIIDVNKQKVSDLGLDWQAFVQTLTPGLRLDFRVQGNGTDYTASDDNDRNQTNVTIGANISALDVPLGEIVNVLVSSGAAKISSSPRIVTTNNRLGSIVDGDHTTYVAKYSTYGEVYETRDLYTGLSLSVIPSIGDNDYLALEIEAKYTGISGTISGNPIETGQILNNHVIVKNNEAFLLGAFKKNVKQSGKKKFPLLGSILPFLFSNRVQADIQQDFLIVVTPTIIDLQGSEISSE